MLEIEFIRSHLVRNFIRQILSPEKCEQSENGEDDSYSCFVLILPTASAAAHDLHIIVLQVLIPLSFFPA